MTVRATTKLSKQGNSTGVTLPREVLHAAGMARGDEVVVTVEDGVVTIRKADDLYDRAMAVGRAFSARYRRTMRALAK